MNLLKYPINAGTLLGILSTTWLAQAQVTITSEDMFNQAGQYYKAYGNANKSDVSVSGRLGSAGAKAQFWDFTSGPTNEVYRFDYVKPTVQEHGDLFPKATLAERKTKLSTGAMDWQYFEQVPGQGRLLYGAFQNDPILQDSIIVYDPPTIDFPDTISYGDRWSTAMTMKMSIFAIDTTPDPDDPDDIGGSFDFVVNLERSSEINVDAHGIINLPGIGFGDGLRLNELVTQTYKIDFGEDTFEIVKYLRIYYWLREDHGVVAQIISKEQDTPPPDNFTTAAQFIRTFEDNHGKGGVSVPQTGVRDLKLTMAQGRVLINWSANSSIKLYRIEYSSDPTKTGPWTKLDETANNFVLDTTISGAALRFYRVIPINN